MKITLQHIFNLAWAHFIIGDGQPSVNEFGFCVYDDGNGNCCAIGLALPKGHPARASKRGFPGIVKSWPELFDDTIRSMTDYQLSEFQARLHDAYVRTEYEPEEYKCGAPRVPEWRCSKEGLRKAYNLVAIDYGLTIPEESK